MSKNSELVIPLRDQPHKVGSYTQKSLLWTVPEGWSTGVLTLPEGAQVPLLVNLTSVDDGVYVEVEATVELVGQCVRCLEPLTVSEELEAAELFAESVSNVHSQTRFDDATEIEVSGDDLDAEYLIEQDQVDLEPLLRDAILGEAPLQPVCSEDCEGICEHCGILLKEAEPDHHHDFIDPRFSALAGLLSGEQNEDEAGN